jgi:NADH-quinone oxidoreductase subunit C
MANDPSQKDPNAVPANPAGPPESIPASPPDAPAPTSAAPPAATPPAAAKPAAPPAAAAPPKPAAPPKEAPPKPVPLDNELTQRFQKRFGSAAIPEAWLDRKQAILIVAREKLLDVVMYCRDEEKFDYLVDLTAVDWPKRERRFDLILNLYSFQKNERLRLKVFVGENEPVASVVAVWPTANWLEREAYDMFGIVFEGHPDLRRILLPEEWQGFPLRKDYDILKQDTAWVKENLGIESGQ